MTPWQIAQQIRFLLSAATWPDAGGVVVFGRVVIVTTAFKALFANFRSPSLAIRPSSATTDPEETGLIVQQFELLLAVAVHGDPEGQSAVIGHGRTVGQTGSQGRGLLEVEEEIKRTIKRLGDSQGVRIVLASGSEGGGVVTDEDKPFAVTRSYNVDTHCTTDRYYHPPQNLVATAGGGSITLTWTLPPTRFDTRRMIVRRSSGSTAPATAVTGTDIPVASLAATVVDSPGAGTWSYAIFMAYDESGSGTDERYSEQETGTTRTAT